MSRGTTADRVELKQWCIRWELDEKVYRKLVDQDFLYPAELAYLTDDELTQMMKELAFESSESVRLRTAVQSLIAPETPSVTGYEPVISSKIRRLVEVCDGVIRAVMDSLPSDDRRAITKGRTEILLDSLIASLKKKENQYLKQTSAIDTKAEVSADPLPVGTPNDTRVFDCHAIAQQQMELKYFRKGIEELQRVIDLVERRDLSKQGK